MKPELLLLATLLPFFSKEQTSASSSSLSCKTIEQILELPDAYKVESYELVFSNKMQVQKQQGKACLYESWAAKAKKGDVISIENIIVLKGDRRIKLAPKIFNF